MTALDVVAVGLLIFIGICMLFAALVVGVERLAVAVNDRRDRQRLIGRSLLGRRLKVLYPGVGDAVFVGRGASFLIGGDGTAELHLVSISGAAIPGLGRGLIDTTALCSSRLIVSIAGPLEPGDFDRPDRSVQRAGP